MTDLKSVLPITWKIIPGFDFYEASDDGQIKSVERRVKHNYGGFSLRKSRILKQYISDDGYKRLGITMNRKTETTNVHRLVALAFIPNPENKPQVNHINGIKTDNRVVNLEWATVAENVKHAYDTGLKTKAKLSETQIAEIVARSKKPITLINVLSGEGRSFECINDCASFLNVKQSTISQAIRRGNKIFKKYAVKLIDAKTLQS